MKRVEKYVLSQLKLPPSLNFQVSQNLSMNLIQPQITFYFVILLLFPVNFRGDQ